MSYLNVVGAARDGEDVEKAILRYLQRWMMYYVAAVEEIKGDTLGSHPKPRTWTVKNKFTDFPEERLPIVLVIATGTSGKPLKDGKGKVRVPFGAGLAFVASGKDRENSRHNAMVYALAARLAMLQRPSLEAGGWIRGVDWQGDQYDDIPDEQARSLAAVRAAFVIDVWDAANTRGGPSSSDPPADPTQPPSNWGKIQTETLTVISEGKGDS